MPVNVFPAFSKFWLLLVCYDADSLLVVIKSSFSIDQFFDKLHAVQYVALLIVFRNL